MMNEWIGSFLMHFRGPAIYVGVLFVLITCGLGIPLPEDAPLIYGGIMIAKHHGSLLLMIATGLAGILIGDSIIFRAGSIHGMRMLETKFGKHIPGEKVARVVGLFEKHGPKFIMVARFVPGLRAVTYFVAGTTGVPYWKFIAYDGLAACVSAPAWVVLGWWAQRNKMLSKVWAWAGTAQVAAISILAGIVLLWVVAAVWRHKRRKNRLMLQKEAPVLRAVEPLRITVPRSNVERRRG